MTKISITISKLKFFLAGVIVIALFFSVIALATAGTNEASAEKSSNVLKTFGKVPELKTEQEQQVWFNKLDELGSRLEQVIPSSFLYPKGPIVSYGHDNWRYWINFKEDSKFDEVFMEGIYGLVEKEAKKLGIEKVPVGFALGYIIHATKTQEEKWRPVIGGILVQNLSSDGDWIILTTLGYAAKKDGIKGWVMTGHADYDGTYKRPTPLGTTMYQPTCGTGNEVGQVKKVGGTYADAAWVEFSNVSPQVWCSGIGYSINGYEDPVVGMKNVWMSGWKSGTPDGTVENKLNKVQEDVMVGGSFRWLYNQWVVSFSCQEGDSGAPIVYEGGHYVRPIIGVLVGEYGNKSVFSPQSGVTDDTGAVPLTIYD